MLESRSVATISILWRLYLFREIKAEGDEIREIREKDLDHWHCPVMQKRVYGKL